MMKELLHRLGHLFIAALFICLWEKYYGFEKTVLLALMITIAHVSYSNSKFAKEENNTNKNNNK